MGRRVMDEDRRVTVGVARSALAAASREGWSRLNGSLTREQALGIFEKALGDRPDDEILDRTGLTGSNIRREVGIDGGRPGLKKPKARRKRKEEPAWPV